MIGIVGRKIGMTQVFFEDGKRVPVTIIRPLSMKVIGQKTTDVHGYRAVEVAVGQKKKVRNKAEKVRFEKLACPVPEFTKEFRLNEENSLLTDGTQITLKNLTDIKFLDVTGNTIGKGFQGVQKRYGFKGGPETHGSNFHRRVGSIGCNTYPSHVFRGKKMPGRMGCKNNTVMNIEVIKIDIENNIIAVKGSVPGCRNGLITMRPAVKKAIKNSKAGN